MNRLLRRLAVLGVRYCCGQPMTWCVFRAAWVCDGCGNRR